MPLVFQAARSHFNDVAKLHAESIADGFLSTLGVVFLKYLYHGIASAPGSGVLVAVDEDGGTLLGFISYTNNVSKCYRHVLRSCFIQLIFALFPNIIRFSIYKKIFETLTYPFRQNKCVSVNSDRDKDSLVIRPELLSMAVNAKARGKGIGRMLVKHMEEELVLMGCFNYYVVTNAIDERSNGFYQSCGASLVHQFENHGKPMHEYYKDIKV